jgi:hypothetical protein
MNGNHETGFDRTYDASMHRFQGQMEAAMGSWSGSANALLRLLPLHY